LISDFDISPASLKDKSSKLISDHLEVKTLPVTALQSFEIPSKKLEK
jgi:hypothetical protein